ncbi:helix-turn-helix transcriptional regulator [Mycolicibacterium sp. J2]|uniref:helix-turn-helix transcriptional regulator n=1 Tax=Mycolicibacterium sp. J2 TaxID=2993511 RepID=UPI00224AC88C|nr:helix-turn-helix transcriptional regulator [Mycolicibacterium sp. J2]MCX2715461.1 helix-turn-helix transcriptional regulator [Mycolicibacterium sp. J2]
MIDLDFASSDVGETEDFLVRAYTKMTIASSSPDAHTTISRRWLGSLSYDELSFTYDMSYDADPLGRIILCRVRDGHINENFIGEPADVFAPGDLTLYSPPELPYSGQVCRATYDLTGFDPDLFNRVAAADGSARPEPVRLTGHRPVSVQAAHRLSSFIDYLRDFVLSDEHARTSPLVVSTASTHLAAATLAAFPNNAVTDPTAVDRRDAGSPVLLRRAISFIDDHAHVDLSVHDIAHQVYVSPRTLQLMFRRHLNCTPMSYLRTVRLHRAHEDLVRADPMSDSVASIAARWGFPHASRFAGYYRAAYGRSPQQTLRG